MKDGRRRGPGPIRSFELMRTLNRLAVLNAVRQDGRLSRAQLATRTGLTSGAITYIAEELLHAGLLHEVGHGQSRGGRRPILLELNPRAVYTVGVNLGVRYTVAVLLDLGARVVHRLVVETPPHGSPEAVAATIAALVERLVAESEVPSDAISGAGIGVPGQLDLDHGVVHLAPKLGWRQVPFRALLAERLTYPLIVDNDVRAATLAEKWYGAGRNVDAFACVFVGSGVGAGIVLGGRLLRGAAHAAGELGHTTLVEDGPRCSCGNYGCLEALSSRLAVLRRVVADLASGRRSLLREWHGDDLQAITLDDVIRAAHEGDETAAEALREAGRYLGIALANLVNLINPEVIAIGGSVAQAGELVLGPARAALEARALEGPRRLVQLVAPQLRDPGATGAAVLVSRQLFLPPAFEGGTHEPVGQEHALVTLRDWVMPSA